MRKSLFRYFGTIKQFHLPDLGEKIKEATVKQWHVKQGDIVKEFQEIADVATDKLHTTIPSEFNGKIHKIFHQEEENCQVGELFFEIELDDENYIMNQTNQQQINTQKIDIKNETNQQQIITQKIFKQKNINNASPSVRTLLKQNNLQLSQIKGTGDHGRVLKYDVIQFIKNQKNQPQYQAQEQVKDNLIKMTDYEKGMQKSMTQALNIPHFYLMEEIDITELAEIRENFKQSQKITFMPFFIKTFSNALNDFPIINASYDSTNAFQYKQNVDHNISIAIDAPKGLVVPNIKRTQDLSMIEIQEQLNKLRDLAQQSKLGAQELYGGTVSISNIGNICGTYTGPLIVSPQVAIVAIGKIQILPKIQNIKQEDGTYEQQLVPRKIVNVSFGGDHRVLNGATVAKFLKRWKEQLENPQSILLNLK